jgi:hypothetical protein
MDDTLRGRFPRDGAPGADEQDDCDEDEVVEGEVVEEEAGEDVSAVVAVDGDEDVDETDA